MKSRRRIVAQDHTKIGIQLRPAKQERKLNETGVRFGNMRRKNLERPRSELGLVSRVSPVQTALRNCTRDEGRSFEVGNQVLISSHRKLLLSKAMVVNAAR